MDVAEMDLFKETPILIKLKSSQWWQRLKDTLSAIRPISDGIHQVRLRID